MKNLGDYDVSQDGPSWVALRGEILAVYGNTKLINSTSSQHQCFLLMILQKTDELV